MHTTSQLQDTVYLDLETDTETNKIVVLTCQVNNSPVRVLTDLDDIKSLIQQWKKSNALIIGQYLLFDCKIIYQQFGILLTNIWCTWAAHKILRFDFDADLGTLISYYLNVPMIKNKDTQVSFKTGASLTKEQYQYCVDDVQYLPALKKVLELNLKNHDQLEVMKLEMTQYPIIVEQETKGMRVNKQQVLDNKAEWTPILQEKTTAAYVEWSKHFTMQSSLKKNNIDEAAFLRKRNKLGACSELFLISSDTQLKSIIATKYELPKDKYKKISLEEDNIEIFLKENKDHPLTGFYKKLLDYRKINKLITTYCESWENKWIKETGRIYPTLNPLRTNTGRYSSNQPNILNLPKDDKIRGYIIPDEDYVFWDGDFNGQEVVIAADKSEEPVLLAGLLSGIDHHCLLASISFSIIFGQQIDITKEKKGVKYHEIVDKYGKTHHFDYAKLRDDHKANLFSMFYGGGAERVYANLSYYINLFYEGAQASAIAKSIATALKKKLNVLMACLENYVQYYNQHGYIMTNSVTRRRISFKKQSPYGDIMNAPIQGTGADMIKYALFRVNKYFKKVNSEAGFEVGRIVVSVYDQLLCQVHKEHIEAHKENIANEMRIAFATYLQHQGLKDFVLKHGVDYQITAKWQK